MAIVAVLIGALLAAGGGVRALAAIDTKAPTVALLSPTNGGSVSNATAFSARATDDVGVTKVRYYVNDKLVGESDNHRLGYALPWDTTTFIDGPKALRAEAFDAAGNKSSATHLFFVKNAVDIPPAPHDPSKDSRVFYIAPNGNDDTGVLGDKSKPFRTIPEVIGRGLLPGDTVYLRGGRYFARETEEFAFSRVHGTAQAPIVISSYPGEKAILDGSRVTLPAGNSLFASFASSHLIVQNLEVVNSNQLGMSATGAHITFRNNHVHNTFRNLMQASGDSITFLRNDLHQGSMQDYMDAVETNSGGLGSTQADNPARPSTNIKFLENTIHEVWGECLNVGSTLGAEVRGNRIYNCHGVGVYLDNAEDVEIASNYIYRTSPAWSRNRSEPHYPQGRSSGILLGAESYPWVHDRDDDERIVRNILITNNIVTGYYAGLSWWPDTGTCPGCKHSYMDVKVMNNVFSGNHHSVLVFAAPDGSPDPSGNVARNNVFHGPFVIKGDDGPLWTRSNNIYPPEAVEGVEKLPAGPQFVGGTDLHNPGRFKLQAGSPLIGKGKVVSEVTLDFWGAPRRNPPSIGAHEK